MATGSDMRAPVPRAGHDLTASAVPTAAPATDLSADLHPDLHPDLTATGLRADGSVRHPEVQVTLRPVPASAGLSRRFVAAALAGWGLNGLVDDATLLVSELVTNAILHARSDIEVALRAQPLLVHVEVRDASPTTPRLRGATGAATTGRGLALVEACSSAWGVEPRSPGKAVWFDLPT